MYESYNEASVKLPCVRIFCVWGRVPEKEIALVLVLASNRVCVFF